MVRALLASFVLAAPLAGAPAITVTVKPGVSVAIRTTRAVFEVSPTGYLKGSLRAGAQRLSVEEPASGDTSDTVRINGATINQFTIDYSRVRASDTVGPLGRGKRVSIPARAHGVPVERTLELEAFENFPGLLVSAVTYRNTGTSALRIDQVTTQQHRINAALLDPKAPPYKLWSFHGAAPRWGQDDVVELTPNFARPNVMGSVNKDGYGGGIPVVAFWTRRAGFAVGHLETLPLVLSVPVQVGVDEHPRVGIELADAVTLPPGQSYVSPRVFQMVYSGDYYEPLRAYSLALQRQGWTLPQPTEEDYAVSWCGWGYGFNVTANEMLGIIPKLKAYGIHWATLDDRWFDTYGDWDPRADTFPGRSIQDMVREYHRNGILVQIWWLPLGVEMPGRTYSSHKYVQSRAARQHPDWLVLDQSGKPATMARGLATLCPALKEVQEYHRQLTLKFIRDWDFDGHKLDNIFSVPACYNPKHRHKSPNDSINAMGEVYRVIFEATRELKPRSVTQSCPCGTPPNIAWLRYMDQAVTADPVGSYQVRRRIKMYKALLGPRAPVYGDHVELTEVTRGGGRQPDSGHDFASTVGPGGVVGTKFVWPQTGPRYRSVALTPDKEQGWKKWMDIYHSRMLSRGEFRNLYMLGYDVPEGYVISKDGTTYYAFFTAYPDESFKGQVELRGLKRGKYRVTDYVNNKDYGTVAGRRARIVAAFTGSLLLEATPQ